MSNIDRALINAEVLEEYYSSGGWDTVKEGTDMDTFGYRFLRLNSQTLALVEIHSDSELPEVCQELYPYPPYLTDDRRRVLNSYYNKKEIKEWREQCNLEFNAAVVKAYNCKIIDYSDKLKTEEREIVLWKILDPLTYWDKLVPLFDNDYNLILRD